MMTLLELSEPADAVTPKQSPDSSYTLRSYQQDAVDATIAAFKLDSKATVLSACGTGKTVTMLALLQTMGSFNVGFFCPNLSLLQQVVQKWREFTCNGIDILIVCSDPKVGKATPEDISEEELTAALPDVEVTQDPNRITEFLNAGNPAFMRRPRIVFGTYQSSHKVATAQRSTDVQFDLIIADEAHYLGTRDRKTTARENRNGEAVRNPNEIRSRRRVFTTATQRVVSSKNGANTESHASMDNPELFGEVVYELSLRDAINLPDQANGLQVLTDYQILVLYVTEQEIDAVYPGHEFTVDINNADTRDAIAAIAATQLRDQYGVTRMISYHSGVERARGFAATLRSNGFTYAETITGDVPMDERKSILQQLSHGGVVTNVNCLTEGIDVPALEAVMLVDPRNSEIDIVQIVGRALRPFRYEDGPREGERKELGYVVLPILVNADGTTDEDVFSTVCDVLRKMAANDDRLRQELISNGIRAKRDADENREMSSGLDNSADTHMLVVAPTTHVESSSVLADQISNQTTTLSHRLALTAFDASVDSFGARLAEFVAWVIAHPGQRPQRNPADSAERSLAEWLATQRTQARGVGKQAHRLTAERIKMLDDAVPWWNADPWTEALAAFVIWLAAHPGQRPKQGSTDSAERSLASWLATQRTQARGVGSHSHLLTAERRKMLDDAVPWWNDDEWTEALTAFVIWIADHPGQKPNRNSSDSAERSLAEWLSCQRTYARGKVAHSHLLTPERRALLDTQAPGWND
jgi:predicted helicase